MLENRCVTLSNTLGDTNFGGFGRNTRKRMNDLGEIQYKACTTCSMNLTIAEV